MSTQQAMPPAPPPGAARHAGPDAVRLRSALGSSSRSLRATRAAAAAGLPPSAVETLGTVVRRGSVGLSELASLEALHPTMLSRIAAKLEEAQLVRRVSDPSDGRAVSLEATPSGCELLGAILAERAAALDAVLETMSAQDLAALRSALPSLEALAGALRSTQVRRR